MRRRVPWGGKEEHGGKLKSAKIWRGGARGQSLITKKVLISVAKGFIDIGIVRERRMNGGSSVRDNFLQLRSPRRAGGGGNKVCGRTHPMGQADEGNGMRQRRGQFFRF